MSRIQLGGELIPGAVDTPLDARVRVNTLAQIADIEVPYEGMIFYVRATKKHYRVLSLASRKIGAATVENAAVGDYEVLPTPDDIPTVPEVNPARLVPEGGSVGQVLTPLGWANQEKVDENRLVPAGGSAGQFLAPSGWTTPAKVDENRLVPTGGATGQVLTPGGWVNLPKAETPQTPGEAFMSIRIPHRADGHPIHIRVTFTRTGSTSIVWFSETGTAKFWTGLEWIDSPPSFGGGYYGGMLLLAVHTFDGYTSGVWNYHAECLIYDTETESYMRVEDAEGGVLLGPCYVEFPARITDISALSDTSNVIGTRVAAVLDSTLNTHVAPAVNSILDEKLYPSWKSLTYAGTLVIKASDGPLQKVTLDGDVVLTAPVLSRTVPALLLEIDTRNQYSVKTDNVELLVSGAANRVQIMWYWNGATGRYPLVVLA